MTAHPDPAAGRPVALPTAWNILHQAISQRRAIRARYHDHQRVLCPHALGWKNGRPKVLAYQTAILDHTSTTDSSGWRSMFVDEIENPLITGDQWQSADNYTPHTTGIDTLAAAI